MNNLVDLPNASLHQSINISQNFTVHYKTYFEQCCQDIAPILEDMTVLTKTMLFCFKCDSD